MAFVTVEKLRSGAIGAAGIPCVTMGAYLADGKAHKSRSVNFRITRLLVDLIGWPLDERTLFLVVREGTDADKGFLQIMPDPQGRRTTQPTDGQGFSLSLAVESFHHYVLNECPVSSGVVQHMIDGDALIIECPDWFRYNPLSVPQPEKPKPVAEEVVAPVAKPTFPKGKATIREARRAASFDELAEKVSANPEVMDLLNRQERRTINKKMQQHLRR